ncbi:MAG: DNA-binding transcriptional LysR family regulator [Alphaproteobacteria bacterium]|jgi:DNA-binding transcriptional LysR family regulator
MDRLQTMSIFVAVAEEAGFSAAARRLHLSAPSVTRAVGELEARLQARLLHRTTRTVRLTDAGARYLADCQRIVSEIEEADSHAAGIHAAPQGIVSLTGSALFGRIVLTPILVELLSRYPDISINTLFVDRVVNLIDEGIDIAVRIADLPDSSLAAIRVGSVRRVLCASPNYLAAVGNPETPNDLAGHDTVDFTNIMPHGEWDFERDGKIQNFKTLSRLRANSADVAIAAAVADRGITRVLSYMVAPELESGELQLVLPDFTPPAVPVHVVHKEQGQTSGRVRAVVDHLADRLRQVPALR